MGSRNGKIGLKQRDKKSGKGVRHGESVHRRIGGQRFAAANPSFHLREGYDVTSWRIRWQRSEVRGQKP